MQYNDTTTTTPSNSAVAIHNYRMEVDPNYAARFRFEQETANQGLQDTSLDILPIGLGLANGIKATGRGLGELTTTAINAPMQEGRRDALKAGGAAAAVGVATSTTVPSMVLSLATKGALPKASKGVNLQALADTAKAGKELENSLYFLRRNGYDLDPKYSKIQEIVKSGEAALSRLGNTKATHPRHGRTMSVRNFEQIAKSGKIDKSIIDALSPAELADLKLAKNSFKVDKRVSAIAGDTKALRDKALSSKDAVLDMPSLKSELARTNKRLSNVNGAPDSQVVRQYGGKDGREFLDAVENNAEKVEATKYLTARKEALESQLNSLSKTGKITQVKPSTIINKKVHTGSTENVGGTTNGYQAPTVMDDMFKKVIDNGPSWE